MKDTKFLIFTIPITSHWSELIIAFGILFIIVFVFFKFLRSFKNKAGMFARTNTQYKMLDLQIFNLTKKNKERLQSKDLEKFDSVARITASIAHEIKNPLTNINLANSQLVEELNIPPSNIFIDIINRNSKKIEILLNNLLKVTEFSELKIINTSINILMDETLDKASERFKLKKISVEKEYAEEIFEVPLDPDKMKITFLNIIFNAIDAMEVGKGKLKIIIEKRDGKCLIIIRDNGEGMDSETLSRIFEPYFSTKENTHGLELTLAQNIILNHNGTIEVKSELGKGTAFYISLNLEIK